MRQSDVFSGRLGDPRVGVTREFFNFLDHHGVKSFIAFLYKRMKKANSNKVWNLWADNLLNFHALSEEWYVRIFSQFPTLDHSYLIKYNQQDGAKNCDSNKASDYYFCLRELRLRVSRCHSRTSHRNLRISRFCGSRSKTLVFEVL